MGPEAEDNQYAAIIRRVGSRNSRRHEVLTGDEVTAEAAKTKNDAWLLESWVKPLRAVSSYSIAELRKMVISAGLRTEDASGKRLKKSELHAALSALACAPPSAAPPARSLGMARRAGDLDLGERREDRWDRR